MVNPYSKEREVRIMKANTETSMKMEVRRVLSLLRLRFLPAMEKAAAMALAKRSSSVGLLSLNRRGSPWIRKGAMRNEVPHTKGRWRFNATRNEINSSKGAKVSKGPSKLTKYEGSSWRMVYPGKRRYRNTTKTLYRARLTASLLRQPSRRIEAKTTAVKPRRGVIKNTDHEAFVYMLSRASSTSSMMR